MCSALVYVGYIVYPCSCNVIDVLVKEHLRLADQMHTCIKTSVCVRFSTCSEGKMMYTIGTYL